MKKGMVNLREYKNLIMAALRESSDKQLLGNLGDEEASKLYHMLKTEDYCMERGITYEELTEDDFETMALKELEEQERYMDE